MPHPVAALTRRKITRRLMPFLFLLYITAYVDRVNVGFAGLDMTRELGFSNQVFGFGSGIFFFGYCLLQIPGALLAEAWSARKWIASIMLVWGLVAALTGAVHTAPQFGVLRFLLGVAEGGFFPAVVIYLTHWYTNAERGKAIGMFMAAIPLANAIGSSVAGLLLRLHWLGLPGWRWLLILEAIPAVIGGIAALLYLPDRPRDARWLAPKERDWISAELERELRQKQLEQHNLGMLAALRHPVVLAIAASYFMLNTSAYALIIWLPKIAQRLSGLDTLTLSLVVAIPYLAAVPATVIGGWHSDKTGDRRWHATACALVAGAGFGLSQWFSANPAVAFAAITVAAMGLFAYFPPLLAWPTQLLRERTAAAGFGFINLTANLGGFTGPYVVGYLTDRTGGYAAGVYLMALAALLGAAVAACLRPKRAPAHVTDTPVTARNNL